MVRARAVSAGPGFLILGVGFIGYSHLQKVFHPKKKPGPHCSEIGRYCDLRIRDAVNFGGGLASLHQYGLIHVHETGETSAQVTMVVWCVCGSYLHDAIGVDINTRLEKGFVRAFILARLAG